MDDFRRVHIDNLVHEACDLLCETAIHRCDGPTRALAILRTNPNAEGVWLDRFVEMFFREHALDNTAGACAVLEALERRPMPTAEPETPDTVGHALRAASARAFAALVRAKAEEALERAAITEGAA